MKWIEEGYQEELIAGIDEVGRGCLAGPVVAATVIMPQGQVIEGVTDSKKLSVKKREAFSQEILSTALAYGFGQVSSQVIDQINIKEASKLAMEEALATMAKDLEPDLVLVDAEVIASPYPSQTIIKGDEKSYNIACASIIAKVYRDRIMEGYAGEYPGYSLETNMGYGTQAHRQAIKDLGYTQIHRVSFLGKLGGIRKNGDW